MKIPLHWRYSALSLISSTWCQLEWVNIDTAGWSQRSAVCSHQKCLHCLIVNIVNSKSRHGVRFSKSAVLLLLCLQAFGLMPGIGGLVMEEEGLAANCTTRLMAAKMDQRHVSDIPFWISVLILPPTLSDCNISLLGRSDLPCVFPRKVIMSNYYQSSYHA